MITQQIQLVSADNQQSNTFAASFQHSVYRNESLKSVSQAPFFHDGLTNLNEMRDQKKCSKNQSHFKEVTKVSAQSTHIQPLRLGKKVKTQTERNVKKETLEPSTSVRSDSLDLARIVTKESTVLLKDIYNDIQSTLKKYDEIIREHKTNKIRNDSMRTSQVKSQASSSNKNNLGNTESQLPSEQQLNPLLGEAFQKHIKTLQEQQQLLILMMQNSQMQEQVYDIIKTQEQFKPDKIQFPIIMDDFFDEQPQKDLIGYSKFTENQAEQAFKDRQYNIAAQLKKFGALKKKNRTMLKMLQKNLIPNDNVQNESKPSPIFKTSQEERQTILSERNNKTQEINQGLEINNIYDLQNTITQPYQTSVRSSQQQITQTHQIIHKDDSAINPILSKSSSKDIPIEAMKSFRSRSPDEKTQTKTKEKKPIKKTSSNKKPIIEVKLNKFRSRKRQISRSIEVNEISSIPNVQNFLFCDFLNNKKKSQKFDTDGLWNKENDFDQKPKMSQHNSYGYAHIHNKKKHIQEKDQFQQCKTAAYFTNLNYQQSPGNSDDVNKKNLIWKQKVSKQQQESQAQEEMKHCTFKPQIYKQEINKSNLQMTQSKIAVADSTQQEKKKKQINQLCQIRPSERLKGYSYYT